MSMIHRSLTVGLVAALLGVAAAADEKETQAVKAGDLGFKAPASWKKETPKIRMRTVQFRVEPVQGDEDPGEMYVTVLPGAVGGVDANVTRWEGQFLDADKKAPKAKLEKKKGINVEVTRIEISGRYVAPIAMGQAARYDKPGYRLIGAMVVTPESGYFLRLTGPEKTVAAATKDFDALIESMKLDK